jgi:hypothetical protein
MREIRKSRRKIASKLDIQVVAKLPNIYPSWMPGVRGFEGGFYGGGGL